MRICLLQTAPHWCKPDENIREAERLIRLNPGADLYLLPEMWATGFTTETLCAGREAKLWMQRMASDTNAAVAGSLAMAVEGRNVNRFLFAMPDGSTVHYDKRHLFAFGNEKKLFTPGNARVIVPWRGMRFLLQICYDLRFPVFMRHTPSTAYDAILLCACWPKSRRSAWDKLLPARAIENQAYVIAVNRTGSEPGLIYNGGSAIYHPDGSPLCVLNDDIQVATYELNPSLPHDYRMRFPVLTDADDFYMEL